MQVISGRPACSADIPDNVALIDLLTYSNCNRTAMRVNRGKSTAVVDYDVVSEAAVPAAVAVCRYHSTTLRRVDILTADTRIANVDTVVISTAPAIVAEVSSYHLEVAVKRPSEAV